MAKDKKNLEKEYDVIVVGTGPAGGTIAHQMSEAGAKVLMLEKGAYHPRWMQGKQIPCVFHFDKMGLLSTKEGLMVARAITVGGSAIISCGAASSPFPGMFEAAGVDLSEDLEESHDYMEIVDNFPEKLIGENQMRLLHIANDIGYNFQKFPKFIDPGRCTGGACMKGCPTGAKWSGRVPVEKARAYGAHLVTRADVTRALVEQGEVVGVETKKGDKYYGKTLILCAGGLASVCVL